MTTLVITRPDDWHLHLRDDQMLRSVLRHTAIRFARAIVMPNLAPPITKVDAAAAYRQRILSALPQGADFTPLMTLYLTDGTRKKDVREAKASGLVFGVKLYPAGATTHSDAGVTRIEHTFEVLECMAEIGLPLLVHGESTDPTVDVFDREKRFIDDTLVPLVERFPSLNIVFEHVTTRDAVQFVESARTGVAATITPQHILCNRNAMFQGGLRPHNYCLPVLKAEKHRTAVLEAATGGNPRFFLGTDSAPHLQGSKESGCGCAGIYSAHAGIELYAEAFAQAERLDRLEAFASHHGADFYGLPRNENTITLIDEPWTVPDAYAVGDDRLVPFRAGQTVGWSLAGQ